MGLNKTIDILISQVGMFDDRQSRKLVGVRQRHDKDDCMFVCLSWR